MLFGGILLAVALMTSGVIFSDLMGNVALYQAVATADPEEVNLRVRTFSSRDDPANRDGRRQAFEARDQFIAQQVAGPIRPYLKEYSRFLETATFYFQGHPQLELHRDIRPRGAMVNLTGLSGRTRMLEGHWPEGAGVPGQPVEVAVDRQGSQLLQLGVGQTMEVFPATPISNSRPMSVRIVGIFEMTDPSDEFWYGLPTAQSRIDEHWTLVPLYTSGEALIDRVLGTYPSLYSDTTWHLFLDRQSLRAEDVEDLQVILARTERAIETGLKNSSYSIRLDTLLLEFEEELLLAGLPMLLMLFLVTGILVYYLFLVAGLIVRSRSGEITMLRSRGATAWQLGILGLGEGLLLAVPAVIAGPFIALGAVKLLGAYFLPVSDGLGQQSSTVAGVSLEAFLVGIAGGALAVAVFTGATLVVARRETIESRQASARPPATTILHRYFIDVGLLAVIGLVWWQLQSRGTFLVQSLGSRELAVDYSLLLGPALGLVAVGLIILRLFPWAAAILFRLVEPVGPAWLTHVLRHLGRDPVTPALLVVLLMLATALGVMGSAFAATLERGREERALYAAGADLRLQFGGMENTIAPADPVPWPQRVDGISAAADVLRTPAYITTSTFSESGTLLAVDTESIQDVAWFRDDFTEGRPIGELLELLGPGPEGASTGPEADGITLPGDATSLVVWARPSGSAQIVAIWARLRDSRGTAVDALIGDLQDTRWSRLELDLTTVGQRRTRFTGRAAPEPAELTPPFDLVSIWLRSRLQEDEGGAMFLGRIDAATPRGEVLVHDFSSTDGWTVIENFSRPGLYSLETSRAAADGEFDAVGRFSWASGGVGLRGVRAGGTQLPIPALVNSKFMEIADAEVGDTAILGMTTHGLLVEIAAEIDYFPTLDPQEGPFAVVDIDRMNQAVLRYSPRPSRETNELWISGTDGVIPPEPVLEALKEDGLIAREVLHGPTMVARELEQPLLNAGWGALLVLMFLAVALASASGLILFSHLDAMERQTEYALLRTLGTSRFQMQKIVWAGLLVMVICGVGLGTFLGWLLGSSLIPLMELIDAGTRITPSLVFTADWQRLFMSYGILAGVTLLCGLWLTWLTGKLRLHQVLRMGE